MDMPGPLKHLAKFCTTFRGQFHVGIDGVAVRINHSELLTNRFYAVFSGHGWLLQRQCAMSLPEWLAAYEYLHLVPR